MTSVEQYMKFKGVTQTEVAEHLGVDKATICRHVKMTDDPLGLEILLATDSIADEHEAESESKEVDMQWFFDMDQDSRKLTIALLQMYVDLTDYEMEKRHKTGKRVRE